MNAFTRQGLKALCYGILPALFVVPAASAADSFGVMNAYEGNDLVGTASGGSVYYESGGVTERIRFRDVDADGDGTYGQALHQAYDQICNPQGTCWYGWDWATEDETNRYSTADGWRVSYMHEERSNINRWRTAPSVCTDQAFEPDACGERGYQYP